MKCIDRYEIDATEMQHCCDLMKSHLLDQTLMIDYDLKDNEYFLHRVFPHSGITVLYYCPWCSKDIRPKEDK